METKGIIIDKKDYDRLVELEKNFDEKVKKNLEEAIKGNLVKILWVKDKYLADLMGCDLKEENINRFISREDADKSATFSGVSYNREELLQELDSPYQRIIDSQRKSIRNFAWAFGILFVAWLILLIKNFM